MKLSRTYLVFFVALLVLSSSIYAQDQNSGSGFSENNDQSSNKVQIDFSDRRTYENLAPHLVANTLKKNLLTFNHSAVGANQPIRNIMQWPKHTALLKQFNLPPSFIEVVEILNDAQTKQKWLFDFKQSELTPVERSIDDQVFEIQSVLDLPEEPKFKLEIRNSPPVVFTTKKPASMNTDQEDSYLESRYYLNGKPITEEKLETLIKDELNSLPKEKTVQIDDMTVGQYAQWLQEQDKPLENKPGSIIGVITNIGSRSLTSFEEHVQKMGYKLSDLNYSKTEIDALKNENSTDPVKQAVWNGLVRVLNLQNLEAKSDSRADKFYRYLLFVHNNENADEVDKTKEGKERLIKAFYHWALVDFENDLGNEKLPEFRELLQKASSREVMILGKKPNGSQGSFVKSIAKIYSKAKEYFVQKAFERAWPIGQGEFFSNIEKLYEREGRWWNRWYDKLFIKNKTSSNQSTASGSKIRIQSTVTPDGIKIEHVQTTPTPENEIIRKNKQFVIDAKNGNEYAVREFFNDPDIKYETRVKALQEAISLDRTEIISVLALDESLNKVLLREFESLVSGYHSRTLRSKLKTIATIRDCLQPDQIQEVKRKHALMHEEVRTLLNSEPGIKSSQIVKIVNGEIQNSYNIKPSYGFNGDGEEGEFNLFDFMAPVPMQNLHDQPVVIRDDAVAKNINKQTWKHDLQAINRNRAILQKQKINRVLHDLHLIKENLSSSEYGFIQDYIKAKGLYHESTNNLHNSYLHYACEHGFHPRIIQMLVEHGYSLNERDYFGFTPLARWIDSFDKNVKPYTVRKELFFKTLSWFKRHEKINIDLNHYPKSLKNQFHIAGVVKVRADRKLILNELEIRDIGYTNGLIKLVNESLSGQRVLDSKDVVKFIEDGVDVFDSYFNEFGYEENMSVLAKVIEIFMGQYDEDGKELSRSQIAEVILKAFEKNPHPENNEFRVNELDLISRIRVGFYKSAYVSDGFESRKHNFETFSEIYYQYIKNDPDLLIEDDHILDNFVYLARQMKREHLEECIRGIMNMRSPEFRKRIYNYYSNAPVQGQTDKVNVLLNARNTYNRTLISQAIHAGVDVELLRQMWRDGADFTIQNDRFVAHEESGDFKDAYVNNNHVDVVLYYAYKTKDKDNARKTLRFLINELGLGIHRVFKSPFLEEFAASMKELGFELEETADLAHKIIEIQREQRNYEQDVYKDLTANLDKKIKKAFENGKVVPKERKQTLLGVLLTPIKAHTQLVEESSKYSVEEIGEFVADIRNDRKKAAVWEELLGLLTIHSDDNFSEIKDPIVKKFYQMGLYVHTHEDIGSEAKKILVLEFWKEILKDFDGRILDSKWLNDVFTIATSDKYKVYIFGETKQVSRTKPATRFEKHAAEWKIGDLKQKYVDWLILRPRDNVNLEKDFFYEIHHEKIGLPEKAEFLRMLNDAGITLHDFFRSTSKMDHIFANWVIANDYQEIQEWNKLGSVKINSQKSFIKVQRENQDMSDWYGFSWACKKANIKPEDVFNGTEKVKKIYAYALISRAMNKIQAWNASHSSEDQIVSLETLKKYGKGANVSDIDLWRDMETSGWIQPGDVLPMEQARIDHQNGFYRNLINRYQRFMVMSFGSAGPKLEYYIQQDNFEKFKRLFKHNGHLMSKEERGAILKAATEPGKGRYLDVIFDEMRFKLDVLPDVVKNKTSYMDSQVGLLLLQKATAQSIFLQKRELLKAVLARTDIDPNTKNNTNKTQLGIATSYFDPETVRLFLENPHTNPNLENGTGYIYTPLATSITPADVSHDGEVTNIGIYADEYNRDIYRSKSAIFENNKKQYRLKVVQLLYDDPRIIMDQQHSGPLVMQEKIGWLLSKNQDPGIANIFKNPPAWQVRGVDIGSVLERMQKWNAARYELSRAVIAEQGEIGKSLSESVLEIFPDLSEPQREVLVAKYAELNYFKIPTFDYSKSIERLRSDINGTNNGDLKAPILIEKKWLVYANRINRSYDQFQALMNGNVGIGAHNKTFSSYQKESNLPEIVKADNELSLAEAHKKLIEESQKYTDEQIKEFLIENAKNPKKAKYWKDLLTQLKILEKTGFWSRFAKSENPDLLKIYDESLGKINDPKVRKFYQWGMYVHEHGEQGSKTKEHLVEAFFKEFLTDFDSQISNKTLVKAIFKKTLEKDVAIYGKVVPMDEFSPRFKAEHPEIAAAFEDYRKQTQLPLKQEIWDAEKLSRIDIVKDEAVASTADFIEEEELPPVVEKNQGVHHAPAIPLEKYEQMINEWNDQHPTKKIYTPEDMQEYLGNTDAHIKTSFYDACQKRNISPGRYFVLNLIRQTHPEYQLDLAQSIAWLNEEIDLYKTTKHSTNIISNSQLLYEWLTPRFQYRHKNGVINPVITNEDITNTFVKYVKPEHQESSMHLKILLTIEDLMGEIKTSVRENPYSWAEVTQYVREIKENTVNKDIWNNLLHTLQIDQDASHSLSMLADIYGYTHQDLENEFQIYQRLTKMDQRRWEFYQYALYVHKHAEVGTQEKYRLVAAFRKILEAEYPYIVTTEEFRKVFKQATDNKIFGEKKAQLDLADIPILIEPITTTVEHEVIKQKLTRWNTLFPKRKIDSKRRWNKYHEEADLQDYDMAEKILSEKNIKMQDLGVTPTVFYSPSKMTIETEDQLRELILNHNKLHPEKIVVQDDYIKISGKYGYPSAGKLSQTMEIDWKYVTGRSDVRAEKLRAKPSEFVIKTIDEFREFILSHNQIYINDQINSEKDYNRVREKYKYMSYSALQKNTGPIDWDYVIGKTEEAKEQNIRGTYTKISIQSELAFRELIINHNRIYYPNEIIEDNKSYAEIATKYKYPTIRTISAALTSIDWDYVTGKTDISANKPPKKYTEFKKVSSEEQLRELIIQYVTTATPLDRVYSRASYIRIASKYGLPSNSSLEKNIGSINWNNVTRKTDWRAEFKKSPAEAANLLRQRVGYFNANHPNEPIKGSTSYPTSANMWDLPNVNIVSEFLSATQRDWAWLSNPEIDYARIDWLSEMRKNPKRAAELLQQAIDRYNSIETNVKIKSYASYPKSVRLLQLPNEMLATKILKQSKRSWAWVCQSQETKGYWRELMVSDGRHAANELKRAWITYKKSINRRQTTAKDYQKAVSDKLPAYYIAKEILDKAGKDWDWLNGKKNVPEKIDWDSEIKKDANKAAELLRDKLLGFNAENESSAIKNTGNYPEVTSKLNIPSLKTAKKILNAAGKNLQWAITEFSADVETLPEVKSPNSGNAYSTVIPFMGYFMPGGVVHRMIIATKMVMDDLTDHFKRWIETIHIPDFSKMTQVLSANKVLSESSVTQKDADALTVSESSLGEPQVSGDGSSSDPEDEEKKMKEVVEEAYSIIHKTGKNPPRTWTLNQVKERIDQYNAEVEDYNATAPKNLQRQKIDGIKKLDPLASVTGLPSRSKIQDLLDHNSKDRYWLFGKVPSDYDLKNEIATYKKLTGKSPIVYRGMIWTAKKLKNDLDAYNEKAPEDQKITGIKMFDKFAIPAGLPDRKMVLPILDNDGQNTDWLFGDDNYDVNSEIIKFKQANPGKEPVVWRGKLWTAAILRQLVAEYNLYALESDKITDWKSWDRFYSKAKVPDRSKAIQVLDIENADHHWMFSRVEETYNLAEEIGKFKAANPGVEPIIFKGKLWTAKLMKESVDQYNKTASGSDQLTNQKLLDKLAAKAKVPYRDIYQKLVKQNEKLSPEYQLTENMWTYKTNRTQESTSSKSETTGKSGNLYTIALPIPPSLFAPNGWLARTFTGVTQKISDTYHSFVTTEQKSRIKTPVGQMSPEQELGGIIADLKGQDGGSELPPEDKKRIEELTKQLRDQGPSFRKRMIEQVAGAAIELPKSFGNFFASLTLAHLWETTNDHSIGSDTFIDIIKGLPTEFLHFTTFSAGASVGTSVAQVGFGVKDMLVEKLLQQQGPQAIKEVESIKGVRQTLIGMTTTRAYVKGQLGMLAGTILNLMIYNKEMTTNEMLLSAFQSQLSFMVAGALVRGVVVRVGVTVGEQLLARGFTILKWAYKGSKCTGIVGIVVLAAEFVVADPINRWFNKIQKNSETIAAAYENIFRLDSWLQNKAIPAMRYKDICATESDELKRGACYAQGAISGLQMYATQMSYWPVNALTMKFQEKQVKVDQKHGSLSQLSESDRDETEWGHGVPIKEGPIGQSEYINENKNLWSEYLPAADKIYKEVREEINSDYQNAFAQLQAGLKQCDDQSLEKCGTEIQNDSVQRQKLLQKLINQLDGQERLRNWNWWYDNRTTKVLGIKPFAIDFEVYNLNEWADQSLYVLKRLAQLNIADKNKFMIQQYFVSQLVTMVGNEFLYGSPVIRTVAQNNQRNNEGELLHSFWKDARGYGQWWRIFELMYNPKASFATSGGTLQGARERENISRDFELAKKYSYELFSKNTLTLIAPRGIEKYGNRKEKLLMDLGHYYACTWSKKVRKDFVASYLNDPRQFEKSEGYLAQQDKYFKQQNDQMKNAKYRLPTDEEWDNYMADQEKEYVTKVPMMFIQVYDQVENVDRFSPEPLIQFKEVVGVTSEMLAQYGSYTTCN